MHIHFSIKTVVALLFLGFFIINACKKDDDKVDCSKVTGATFISNSGKIQTILANNCSSITCHGAGGDGTQHWTFTTEYDSLVPHFDHMYEAVVIEKVMPRPGSPQLTQEELDVFECWKQAGFPE